MKKRYWQDLTTLEFRDLDPERTIAVLPIAAVEQHGPHLPVSTDTEIALGMIRETLKILPESVDALFLPVQAVGKSNEHIRSPGTLTLDAETAIRAWREIGESVARAGVRKLVMVNSHGGNVECIGIVARELRIQRGMLAVQCQWSRFGVPEGLYTDQENAVGIHAGDQETSLMLHFRPDLVDMTKAKNFEPVSVEMSRTFDLLRPTGFSSFGWIAQDLNADGACGNASSATAEKGRATAQYRARQFVRLLGDVETFELKRLGMGTP